MLLRTDSRIRFLVKTLLLLVFLAKVSLVAFYIPVPQTMPYLIFQSGMHPYVNVVLCALFGLPLFVLWRKVDDRIRLSSFYKIFISLLFALLTLQSLLQIRNLGPQESVLMQVGGLLMALLLIVVYGLVIPTLWTAQEFLVFIQKWSGIFIFLSILVWLIGNPLIYKGGRFIGIFKHIPHMVTCATVAFIFSLETFFYPKNMKHKIWSLGILVLSFGAIVMTGTRSSAAAALVALVLGVLLYRSHSNSQKIAKFMVVGLMFSFLLFFGKDSIEFAVTVATGKATLGTRQAQDGVSSRWDEVERGLKIFEEEPWIGHGLISKFSSGNDVDVSNYNSFKDPHNIFISAGVTGGWPLIFLSVIAVFLMSIGSVKALGSVDFAQRQIAIYLLVHIPIMIIYHIHLSIGGMADRMYWLVFGFVACIPLKASAFTKS